MHSYSTNRLQLKCVLRVHVKFNVFKCTLTTANAYERSVLFKCNTLCFVDSTCVG